MGGNRGLESLHPALLAIINNIAPYVQDLQRATSSKLLNAFATMSQPSFLLANETNHVLLFSLLDAVNAILENQYEGMWLSLFDRVRDKELGSLDCSPSPLSPPRSRECPLLQFSLCFKALA